MQGLNPDIVFTTRFFKAKTKAISNDSRQLNYTTAPLYNISILFDTVVRQKRILNMENNEFKSVAILHVWHASGNVSGYFNGMKREDSSF